MIKTTRKKTSTNNLRRQQGVHIHLFGINNNGNIISTLILTRSDNGLRGIISGKIEPGETAFDAARRELVEEIGRIPLALIDTGKKIVVQCNKYEFHVSVFSGLILHNSPLTLNYENSDYEYINTVFSPYHIDITDQRKNHIHCINRAREMYQTMMK